MLTDFWTLKNREALDKLFLHRFYEDFVKNMSPKDNPISFWSEFMGRYGRPWPDPCWETNDYILVNPQGLRWEQQGPPPFLIHKEFAEKVLALGYLPEEGCRD
jgi:hypothetical protein